MLPPLRCYDDDGLAREDSDIDPPSSDSEECNLHREMLTKCVLDLHQSVTRAQADTEAEKAAWTPDGELAPKERLLRAEARAKSARVRLALLASTEEGCHDVAGGLLDDPIPVAKKSVSRVKSGAAAYSKSDACASGFDLLRDGCHGGDESVSARYRSQNVPKMVEGLRKQMQVDGDYLPRGLPTGGAARFADRTAEIRGEPTENERRQRANAAHIRDYQEALRGKFMDIGVPGAKREVFFNTDDAVEAVRDGLVKYHTHCNKLGVFFAMPGEENEQGGILGEQKAILESHVRDLEGREPPGRIGTGRLT